MARIRILLAFVCWMPAMLFAEEETYWPVAIVPPQPAREFRGAWLVTVANKDWPSKPGLPVAAQKAELAELLDRAAQLKLNAIIFQVRPSCDAMYASAIEPWSEYLTGTMGKAPEPFYDPLAFAIEEAHRRGLELHAWFNPFRALHEQARSPVAPNHVSRTHPEWVRHYGSQLWLDPGEPSVRVYVLGVIMDVVRRYDVDGVQLDDYFYPYPEKDAAGRELGFPDDASWRNYGLSSRLSRDDWRRANINAFVQGVYQNIKAAKPWVKFGVSPFGIWRPMNPLQIRGMDAYAKLYADSRRWLANGWLDYFSPQLYWSMDTPQQSFPVLLNWWAQQNVQGRHLWPGLDAANVGEKWGPDEIARQIAATRQQPGAGGEIFYHLRNLTDTAGLANVVRAAYPQPALVPASPWLEAMLPGKPRLTIAENSRTSLRLQWQTADSRASLWILQFRTNQVWTTEILPAARTNWAFAKPAPDLIAISAVDRADGVSTPAALRKYRLVPVGKGTYIWR
ncbi:MAG TPA: family 10 glycosylhydrolase [Verrucomicrobiae bacterium]|nr:family 10 glycosylhydrolase [Verrucomicrobiae bacterium]